jgi:uncharacterized membrane protein
MVLNDPTLFAAALARSFDHGKLIMLQDLVGPNVGWIHVPIMPWPIIVILTISLAAAAGLQRFGTALRIPTRCAITIVIIANVVVIHFLLYLQFTPVANPWVEGAQGRYFIPLIAALPVLVSGPPIAQTRRATLESPLLACGALGAWSTLAMVFASYWQL